jgi:hypothetical protein
MIPTKQLQPSCEQDQLTVSISQYAPLILVFRLHRTTLSLRVSVLVSVSNLNILTGGSKITSETQTPALHPTHKQPCHDQA